MYRLEYDISGLLKSDKKKLQKNLQQAGEIKRIIEYFLQDPFANQWNIKKLSPKTENKFRLRIAEYRVIYSIDTGNKIILIHRIALRKDIYK